LIPHAPVPVSPVLNNFLPSKTSWVKEKRSALQAPVVHHKANSPLQAQVFLTNLNNPLQALIVHHKF